MKYSRYRVQDDRILFDFYEFYFSSLKKNPLLTIDRINEVDFNTYPCSMDIDNGELIFFNHGDTDSIEEFVERNNIQRSEKIDVWRLLCDEFLDTELSDEEARRNHRTLLNLQFSESDLREVRDRIKWTLFGTMEWVYLGHWDLLAMKQYRSLFYRLNGTSYYWWTMRIAMKGKTRANQ